MRMKKELGARAGTSLLIRQCTADTLSLGSCGLERFAGLKAQVHVEGIIRECELLAATDGPVWYRDRIGYHVGKKFRSILYRMMAMDECLPEEMFVGRRMNEQLSLLVPFFRKWGRRLAFFEVASDNIDVSSELARRVVNRLAYSIRRLMRHPRISAAVKDQKRRAHERYLSCAKDILGLLKQFPKLLVLRVDLYFEGEGRQESVSPEARRAFDKFLNAFRAGVIIPGGIDDMSGIEDGLSRRVHFHFCAVLDGNRHQNGYALSEALGKYWVEECVGSPTLASYTNCWLRQGEYRFNGLGLVTYYDSKKLMGLREAIEYVTKYVPYGLPPLVYGRKLRKGLVPKVDRVHGRGAPRKYGYDLEVAKRVLLTEAAPVPLELRALRRRHLSRKVIGE